MKKILLVLGVIILLYSGFVIFEYNKFLKEGSKPVIVLKTRKNKNGFNEYYGLGYKIISWENENDFYKIKDNYFMVEKEFKFLFFDKKIKLDLKSIDYTIKNENEVEFDMFEIIYTDSNYRYEFKKGLIDKVYLKYDNGYNIKLMDAINYNLIDMKYLIDYGYVQKEEYNNQNLEEVFQNLIDNIIFVDLLNKSTDLNDLSEKEKIDLFFYWYKNKKYGETDISTIDNGFVNNYLKKYYNLTVNPKSYNGTFGCLEIMYKNNFYNIDVFMTNVPLPEYKNLINLITEIKEINSGEYLVEVKKAYTTFFSDNNIITDGINNLMEYTQENHLKLKSYLENNNNLTTYTYTFKLIDGDYKLIRYEINLKK